MKLFKFGGKQLSVELQTEADNSVFYEIFSQREYAVLDEAIKKAEAPIIDIGAHIGLFSLYASCLNSAVRILAFEPEERNFSMLKENLQENGVKNVVVKNVAVGAEEGRRKLFISEDSHNHSLVGNRIPDVDHLIAGRLEDDRKELDPGSTAADRLEARDDNNKMVQVITMERIFLKNGLERVSLVKMDCEGAEFEILPSMPAEIFQRIDCFYIEYHKLSDEMRPEILRNILLKNAFKVQMSESRYDKKFGFILARR